MQFQIFQPKFTWTKTNIINSFLIFTFLIFTIEVYFYSLNIVEYFLISSLCLFVIGMLFKINNLNDVEKLKGEFVGYFELMENEILIQKHSFLEIIKVGDVKKIEITGVDWNGLRTSNYLFEFNYENGLSNGTKNFLHIEFKNNQKIKIQFEKLEACQFKKIRPIIEQYYKQGIISDLNSIDILCITKKQDTEEFKKLK